MATNIPPVSAGQLIESAAWGNQVRTEVSNLEANKVSKSGSTMTGLLTANVGVLVTGTQRSEPNSLTRKDYVDAVRKDSLPKAGGVLTGPLSIDSGASTNVIFAHNTANTPRLTFAHDTTGELLGYLSSSIASTYLYSDNALTFYADAEFSVTMVSQRFLLGRSNPDDDVAGAQILTGGNARGRLSTTVSYDEGYANAIFRHMSEMDADKKYFVVFQHGAAATIAGSITQGAGNSVHFNETSDYRLKNVLGPVVDATARVVALIPRRLEFISDPGLEFDGFLAHEVDVEVPYAVTGEKDAILPEDDPFNPGGIDAQQLDLSKLVPLVVAALQETIARVDVLEGAAS